MVFSVDGTGVDNLVYGRKFLFVMLRIRKFGLYLFHVNFVTHKSMEHSIVDSYVVDLWYGFGDFEVVQLLAELIHSEHDILPSGRSRYNQHAVAKNKQCQMRVVNFQSNIGRKSFGVVGSVHALAYLIQWQHGI